MDFKLTETQEILRRSARDFLERRCPKRLVREMETDEKGFSPELEAEMAALGWYGLAFPEEYGGAGADFTDLLTLLEEMGRALLPGTFFPTVVLGGLSVLEAGSEAQKKNLLPRIVRGEVRLTLALNEAGSWCNPDTIETSASAGKGGYVISGTKVFVPYAHAADFLVCAARTGPGRDDIGLFLIGGGSPGVSLKLLENIAGDKQYEVVFKEVNLPADNLLGQPGNGRRDLENILQKAAAAMCAWMVGGAQKVLDMTVEYTRDRIQFGKPIGSFQIIQSHCAEMLSYLEEARLLTAEAGWRLSQGLPAGMEVSMAKARASQAYQFITALAHEIHGGVGYAVEHDLPLYFRRAKAAELAFGDSDFHREKVATALGL